MPDSQQPSLEAPVDPRRELDAIRGLMERAREYRHPPAPAGFVAGVAGFCGGMATQGILFDTNVVDPKPNLVTLAEIWGLVFAVAFGAVVLFTSRAAKREGRLFWSPLAKDVVHALWPSLLAAAALTVVLARTGQFELIAAVWLLAYGVGGIAAGAFASPIVRRMGLAFLLVGLAQLVSPWRPGMVLAMTFGGLHLLYGVVVALRPRDVG